MYHGNSQAPPTWVPDMDMGVDEAGQPGSAVGGDAVGEGLEGRGLAAEAIQSLHQQLGTLDVRYQGNSMFYCDPSGDVALRNEGGIPSNTGEG